MAVLARIAPFLKPSFSRSKTNAEASEARDIMRNRGFSRSQAKETARQTDVRKAVTLRYYRTLLLAPAVAKGISFETKTRKESCCFVYGAKVVMIIPALFHVESVPNFQWSVLVSILATFQIPRRRTAHWSPVVRP